MVAITRSLAAHSGQRSASTPYVRRSSKAHSTRDDAAYSRSLRASTNAQGELLVGRASVTLVELG
jgi:hypothetical protein